MKKICPDVPQPKTHPPSRSHCTLFCLGVKFVPRDLLHITNSRKIFNVRIKVIFGEKSLSSLFRIFRQELTTVFILNTLRHTVTHCNTATHCNTLQSRDRVETTFTQQHTATHSNTLQHTATHCNTLQQHTATHCNTLQHTATHCNTLQHTATHCNTLQWRDHVETTCALHHTATHCNTLQQQTATICNTLQHTATHCNCEIV